MKELKKGENMKRYYLEYDSDKINYSQYREDFRYSHFYGYASTIKRARGYIREVKERYADQNPRNFRVYDGYGDIDPETNFVYCVYHEE